MPTDVIMPALGVAQEKGTLIHWFKSEGQPVSKGEPLMEVETDKATVEIEAPATGILANVTAFPGDEVPVGNKIAVIVAPGETPTAGRGEPPHPRPLPEGEGIAKSRSLPQGERRSPATSPVAEPAAGTRHIGERILASPAARRIARELGLDISTVRGSGPEGAVIAEDLRRMNSCETAAAGGLPKVKETLQLTAMRRIIGERMARSKQTAPHFYLTMDADMTAITRQRDRAKERGEELIPSINDFILSACARALRDFPSLNAAFTEQGVQLFTEINLGMAVALEEGLVVPVIRNADSLSFMDLARKSRDLAEKAQRKKLFPADYEGGTFTLSNLGMLGVDNFIAIINPPQCAILAVGRVAPRVIPEGAGVGVRPMMTMSLSADHRVVDGAVAARFLREIKQLLEEFS